MKRTVTLLALLAALCCLLTVSAAAADAPTSGTCGENLTWTLDGEGTLRIAGEGAMEDYGWPGGLPWRDSQSEIKAVVIESGVTTIGSHAFDTCRNLTSVTFNGSSQLTTIGKDAFYQCRSLTGITLPESVTSIGASAFYQCTALTSITIPEGVTAIDERTFYNCSSLASINIPEGVTAIGEDAFSGCSSLTSVTFTGSSQLTTIGESAFYRCSSLTGIALPESVTSIGGEAFRACENLTKINIPESVTSIGKSAFSYCESLTDVFITNIDAWCRIDFGDAPMGYAKNIWLNGSKITSVTVPAGITDLNYTFAGFKDLIQVVLPESVTAIGEDAFGGCRNLTSVTFAENSKLTTIGDNAFSGCTSLTGITIPDGVTTIGDNAFSSCSSLTSITIPEGVTTIGSRAFYYCDSLADVYITNLEAWCRINFTDSQATPMCYAKNIYLNGEKIVSVTVPGGITEVKAYTFFGFKDLIQVTIPEGVTAIGERAFDGCRSLPDIILPTSVTTIGDYAFFSCDSLISVTFAENSQLTTIGEDAFSECRNLTGINFPEGITSIGDGAFRYCSRLSSIEIPEGVTVIQPGVFSGASSIQRVALPKSLKGVLANAFSGCRNIQEVFYAGSEAEWKALPISAGNDPLKNAQVYFGSTLDDYYCRISVAVSGGGRVTVDHAAARAGDTVTVTAAPYQGYELSAICVDGAAIQGNTFTVTGNHTVSAVFTRVPVVGGTEDFRLEGLSVRTAAGETLQELPQGSLLVTVAVRHLNESGSGTILLAQYDSLGRYRGLMWLTLDEMPQGMTLRVTLPVDNSSGEIANLKVFVVEDLTSPLPVGTPVSFGQV